MYDGNAKFLPDILVNINCGFDLSHGESQQYIASLIIYNKEVFFRKAGEVWDFRKCEEYPDCLPCWESGCPLLSDDYNSPTHTYCVEKCRVGYSLPRCDDDCIFLEAQKRSQIFKAAEDALFDGVVRTEKVSGMDVKVVDLYLRESAKAFEDEFTKRDEKKPRLQAFTEKSGGKDMTKCT